MSMQKGSVQGNLDARMTDIANAIARTWVERLERDSMQWTQPSALSSAPLLSSVTGNWFLPTAEMGGTPETMSPGFDILGRDVDKTHLSTATFCANVRLNWLVAPNLPLEPGLLRADVRVLWPRGLYNSPMGTASGFCNTDVASADDPDSGNQQPMYHSLYVTTTIRENAQ
jgi:hypothetical protein